MNYLCIFMFLALRGSHIIPFPFSTLPLLGLDPPTNPPTSSTSPIATFLTGGSTVESVEDCTRFLVLLRVLGGDLGADPEDLEGKAVFHIVMLQCTIRYEPPNGHTVSHDMGSANSLSQ